LIPGLPQVGGTELLILLVIILLIFGTKGVPEVARSLGRGEQQFRRGVEEAAAEASVGKTQQEKGASAGAGQSAG
jgi:sec-independent protein translocase protein TatA